MVGLDHMGIGVLAISAGLSLSALFALLLLKARRRPRLCRASWSPSGASKVAVARHRRTGNRGGRTGQTSKSTGAEAQCPGGKLRGPAELIKRGFLITGAAGGRLRRLRSRIARFCPFHPVPRASTFQLTQKVALRRPNSWLRSAGCR